MRKREKFSTFFLNYMCFKETFPKSNIRMSNIKEKKGEEIEIDSIISHSLSKKKKKNHFRFFFVKYLTKKNPFCYTKPLVTFFCDPY